MIGLRVLKRARSPHLDGGVVVEGPRGLALAVHLLGAGGVGLVAVVDAGERLSYLVDADGADSNRVRRDGKVGDGLEKDGRVSGLAYELRRRRDQELNLLLRDSG